MHTYDTWTALMHGIDMHAHTKRTPHGTSWPISSSWNYFTKTKIEQKSKARPSSSSCVFSLAPRNRRLKTHGSTDKALALVSLGTRHVHTRQRSNQQEEQNYWPCSASRSTCVCCRISECVSGDWFLGDMGPRDTIIYNKYTWPHLLCTTMINTF